MASYIRTPEIRAKNRIGSTHAEVGYHALHYRVYAARGPARLQTCISCGLNAQEWAQVHGSDPYDVLSYQPMCLSCHARYDQKQKAFGMTPGVEK